jgi:hypothetical protein
MRPNPPVAQCSQDISLESQSLGRSLFGGIVGIDSRGEDKTFLGSKDVELGEQERGGVERRFGKEEEEEDGDEDCHTSFHCERSVGYDARSKSDTLTLQGTNPTYRS